MYPLLEKSIHNSSPANGVMGQLGFKYSCVRGSMHCGPSLGCLFETVLKRGQNVCYCCKIRGVPELSSKPSLIWSSGYAEYTEFMNGKYQSNHMSIKKVRAHLASPKYNLVKL